jgi:hypothetical protein
MGKGTGKAARGDMSTEDTRRLAAGWWIAIVIAVITLFGSGLAVEVYKDWRDAPQPVTTSIGTAESVVHGEDNEVTVSAEGLGARSLWVVAVPDEGEGYYIISDSPILPTDGERTFTDWQVGDESDVGRQIKYLAYAADQNCAKFLEGVDRVTPTMDDSCGEPVATAAIKVM